MRSTEQARWGRPFGLSNPDPTLTGDGLRRLPHDHCRALRPLAGAAHRPVPADDGLRLLASRPGRREAVFHLFFRRHPFGGQFTVACGLAAAIDFIERFRFAPDDLAYLAHAARQRRTAALRRRIPRLSRRLAVHVRRRSPSPKARSSSPTSRWSACRGRCSSANCSRRRS